MRRKLIDTASNHPITIPPGFEPDFSGEMKVEVNKSRTRKSWDAIWAKPRNWWSGLSKGQQHRWMYLFGLICYSILVSIVGGMIYVTYDHIPQRVSKEWAKYARTRLDSISEWGLKLKRETHVLTESAITTVGLSLPRQRAPAQSPCPSSREPGLDDWIYSFLFDDIMSLSFLRYFDLWNILGFLSL
jgi:hypothetical protein